MQTRTKLFLLAMSALILLIVGWQLLSTGKVEVTTSPGVSSSFSIRDETGKTIETKKGKRIAERLRPGEYSVTAEHDKGATKQSFTIKARDTLSLVLKLEELKTPVLITDRPAVDIQLGSGLLFVDPTLDRLFQLKEGSTIPQPLFDTVDAQRIEWLGQDSGLIQTTERNGYYFDGSMIRDIGLVSVEEEDQVIINAVSADPGSRSFVYSSAKELFISRNLAPRQHLLTVDKEKPSLALKGGNLAFFYYPEGFPEYTTPEPAFVFDLTSSTKTEIVSDQLIFDIHWSASGDKLIYDTPENLYIYDYQARRVINRISKNLNVAVPVLWLNDADFLYGDEGGIWRFELNSSQAIKLANASGANEGFDIARRLDSDEIFFSNGDSASPGIYKLLLAGDIPENTRILAKILPSSTVQFEIKYSALAEPATVLIQTFVDRRPGTTPAEYLAKAAEYKKAALDFLQSHGVDTSKIRIHYLE